jgi:hypothetical protein
MCDKLLDTFSNKRSFIVFITFLSTICLVFVVLSTPIIRSYDIVNRKVIVGNVNGSISFGTLGYCLHLPNNLACSNPKFLYKIGQFKLPVTHFKTSSYLLFFSFQRRKRSSRPSQDGLNYPRFFFCCLYHSDCNRWRFLLGKFILKLSSLHHKN